MEKRPNNHKSQNPKQKKSEEKESSPLILSMGIIDITLRIEFSNEDLEIDQENQSEKKYYDIKNFRALRDLQFLKERKKIWDKFQLIPNSTTLQHLLLSNCIRKKNVITEYIGFGRPSFTDDEEFFEEIFNYVSKKNNILFNKTSLNNNLECRMNFEFVHKKKFNSFEIKKFGEESNEDNKEKNDNKPIFSRKDSFFSKMNPENSKYNLFYLDYEELIEFSENFDIIDLVELIYFLKKRGAKIFLNFYKKEKQQLEGENEEKEKESDNPITKEHFQSHSIIYNESENYEEEEEEEIDSDEKSIFMKNLNSLYYYIDLYFFDTKQTLKQFNNHYQFFTADKIKSVVNKDNLYDYFIKGIATGTKDEVESEKFGFFIEYFSKLYIIRADKNIGNKYEFDLKIHPQINHFNMNEIQKYKKLIKNNKNYYISLILSYILGSIIENNSTTIDTLFKGYLNGLLAIKKNVELGKNNISIDIVDNNIMKPNITDSDIDIKVKTLTCTGQENGFILDCLNKEKSKLKDYVPLYDTHMINFLKSTIHQKELKKKGFINDKGFIMLDHQYRNMMRDDEQVFEEDKKQNKKLVEKNIKRLNVVKEEKDRLKNPKKDISNIAKPTKKKIPTGKMGPGSIYNTEASNYMRKKKKNVCKGNKEKNKEKKENTLQTSEINQKENGEENKKLDNEEKKEEEKEK